VATFCTTLAPTPVVSIGLNSIWLVGDPGFKRKFPFPASVKQRIGDDRVLIVAAIAPFLIDGRHRHRRASRGVVIAEFVVVPDRPQEAGRIPVDDVVLEVERSMRLSAGSAANCWSLAKAKMLLRTMFPAVVLVEAPVLVL